MKKRNAAVLKLLLAFLVFTVVTCVACCAIAIPFLAIDYGDTDAPCFDTPEFALTDNTPRVADELEFHTQGLQTINNKNLADLIEFATFTANSPTTDETKAIYRQFVDSIQLTSATFENIAGSREFVSRDGSLQAVVTANAPPNLLMLTRVDQADQQVTIPSIYGTIYDVAISPDNRLLLFSELGLSNPAMIRACDLTTGEALYAIKGLVDSSHPITFSPDGSKFAIKNGSQTIRIYNSNTGKKLHDLEANQRVQGTVFIPDINLLVSIGSGNELLVWDIPSEAEIFKMALPDEEITHIGIGSNGSVIVTRSNSGTVRLLGILAR